MKKLSEKKKKWIQRTVANDRSYKYILYNRFFVLLFSVILQLVGYGVVLYAFAYDSTIGVAVQTAVEVLKILFILQIINDAQRPSSKLNWIILILLFPVFGVPMYLFNGAGKPTKRMKRRVAKAKEEVFLEWGNFYGQREIPPPSSRAEAITHYLEKVSSYPVYHGGDLQYYPSGEAAFGDILDTLKSAKKFILIEYFIIAHGKMWSEILKILLEKAENGVKTYIIYDDFGCMMTLPPEYEKYLESLHPNIKCMTFNDVVPIFSLRMNNRDHRKMLVVDGKTAFTGGINLADEYIGEKRRFGYWKDSVLRVKGNPVNSFTAMFFYIWNAFRHDKVEIKEYLQTFEKEEKCVCIQPYDDSPLDNISVGETVYVDMIDRAKDYVWIFTPYLILDDFIRSSLCRAAMRGVDVRIVTPGIPDKKITYRLTRANYDILMRAGVKIYEYTPGFLHAKSMLIDDECAVVGTINLDYRSVYHHFENAVYFSNCKALNDLKRDCEEVFSVSKLCLKENTKRRFLGRLTDGILRVFETMF